MSWTRHDTRAPAPSSSYGGGLYGTNPITVPSHGGNTDHPWSYPSMSSAYHEPYTPSAGSANATTLLSNKRPYHADSGPQSGPRSAANSITTGASGGNSTKRSRTGKYNHYKKAQQPPVPYQATEPGWYGRDESTHFAGKASYDDRSLSQPPSTPAPLGGSGDVMNGRVTRSPIFTYKNSASNPSSPTEIVPPTSSGPGGLGSSSSQTLNSSSFVYTASTAVVPGSTTTAVGSAIADSRADSVQVGLDEGRRSAAAGTRRASPTPSSRGRSPYSTSRQRSPSPWGIRRPSESSDSEPLNRLSSKVDGHDRALSSFRKVVEEDKVGFEVRLRAVEEECAGFRVQVDSLKEASGKGLQSKLDSHYSKLKTKGEKDVKDTELRLSATISKLESELLSSVASLKEQYASELGSVKAQNQVTADIAKVAVAALEGKLETRLRELEERDKEREGKYQEKVAKEELLMNLMEEQKARIALLANNLSSAREEAERLKGENEKMKTELGLLRRDEEEVEKGLRGDA